MKILKRSVVGWFLMPGFTAITFGPYICLGRGVKPTERLVRHETIHSKQQAEMLWIPFFVWYLIEWGVRLFISKTPYKSIGFEREAYGNEANSDYLCKRKRFAWWRYL